ncbi:MAG: esterase-like activity of phytase family protein [Methyloligellaceae bacterium]
MKVRVYSLLFLVSFCIALLSGGVLYVYGKLNFPAEQKVEVSAAPISFDRNATDRIKFGRLIWRGGLVLRSDDKRFGGISGLTIDRQGKHIVGITDNSSWIKAELVYHGQRLSGINNVMMGPLKGPNKKPFLLPNYQDAEAIVAQEDGFLISFERNHRIGKFTSVDGRPDYQNSLIKLPADSHAMAYNGGIEALASIAGGPRKGQLVVFSESLLDSDKQHIRGWLLDGNKSENLYLKAMGGFSVTEVASLDNGALLFLERRYTRQDGVSMRIRLVKSNEIKPNARLVGEILLEADTEFQIDNMEGLAVHKNNQGQSIITLVSDDNFSNRQRTLVLQFELGQTVPNAD